MADTPLSPGVAATATALVKTLRLRLPNLLAVYLFGSQATNAASATSDWDVAVWVEGKLTPLKTWELGSELAQACGQDVDLVDLRSASTVMQYQVITTGQCLWQRDASVEVLEAMVLSEKTYLDEARGPLLEDILARGSVHGG